MTPSQLLPCEPHGIFEGEQVTGRCFQTVVVPAPCPIGKLGIPRTGAKAVSAVGESALQGHF